MTTLSKMEYWVSCRKCRKMNKNYAFSSSFFWHRCRLYCEKRKLLSVFTEKRHFFTRLEEKITWNDNAVTIFSGLFACGGVEWNHTKGMNSLRQPRTKLAWRLCTPSACKFPVIFHKNAREYIKYSLRFLFHLTINLTTHLSHKLCAVLP